MRLTSSQLRDLAWTEVQALVERQLKPLGDLAIARLDLSPGDRVVDIGCGAGGSLRQLAEVVGPDGAALGIDLSTTLADRARTQCAGLDQVSVVAADAQTMSFEPANFSAAFSRFGVMFFDNPMAAFSNIRHCLRPNGQFAFVCWRSLQENELDFAPLAAAAPAMPKHLVDEAGQALPFSLANRQTIEAILSASGFRNCLIEPHDLPVSSGDLNDMLTVSLKVGSLGSLLREHPDQVEAVRPLVEAMLRTRAGSGDVYLNAAVWVVTATA